MSSKRILTYLLFPIVLFLLSVLFRFADSLSICPSNDQICAYKYYSELSRPFLTWGKITIIWAIIVIFFKPLFSSFVKKGALIYLILSAALIGVAPVNCGGFFVCFEDKDIVSWLTAGGFLLITLLLIASQKLKEARARKQPL